MTGSDDEFEDFLKRRKPRFLPQDDMFEPPAELDRVVLRQAREAIESERPLKVFHGPRWAAPVALAATMLLAVTILFQASTPSQQAPVPEVTVQNIAERVEVADAAAPMAPAPAAATNNHGRADAAAGAASDTVMVDLANPMVAAAKRASGDAAERSAAPPPTAPMVVGRPSESVSMSSPLVAGVPAWRQDPKTWKAEIERLRGAGDDAAADAELAEFNRQQRAYAVGPDR